MPDDPVRDDRGVVTVIGVLGDTLDSLEQKATATLRDATTVAGGRRHMKAWRPVARSGLRADPGLRCLSPCARDPDIG